MVRIKNRYLVCFISIQPQNFNSFIPGYPGCQKEDTAAMRLSESDLLATIKQNIILTHGSLGVGKCMSRLRVIHWCPASGLLIIRCLRSMSVYIQTALSLVTHLDLNGQKRKSVIDIYHTSGTVRGCQKFLVMFYSHHLFSRPEQVFRTALSIAVERNMISPYPPYINEES
ncbi:unnamed protein product [Schistosoma rodhaini]|uniref:Ribonuclease P/MRP protein subunit POP5 n=1 Tax=Schistosoma rodhaini TaxID=6188 RepID=A0A183R654_9TREM|nr:unnamed protein product [Schistosoma rodhaini]CAH8559553.1 unnamed protein product [Schistosoma rodhaini]